MSRPTKERLERLRGCPVIDTEFLYEEIDALSAELANAQKSVNDWGRTSGLIANQRDTLKVELTASNLENVRLSQEKDMWLGKFQVRVNMMDRIVEERDSLKAELEAMTAEKNKQANNLENCKGLYRDVHKDLHSVKQELTLMTGDCKLAWDKYLKLKEAVKISIENES